MYPAEQRSCSLGLSRPSLRWRAVDIQRAADLYAQGRSPYQVGAELGVTATTVAYQLTVTRVWLGEGSTALIHRCRPSAYTTPPFLAFFHRLPEQEQRPSRSCAGELGDYWSERVGVARGRSGRVI
jgi:hypothetical protein